MNKKQKRIAVFSILILMLLSATGYFILKQIRSTDVNTESKEVEPKTEKPVTTPPPITQQDPKENWNVYKSQKYNFEFKYPPESNLSDQSDGYVAVSFMGDKQKASGRTQTELFDGYAFNIADVTGEGYKDLDEFYSQKVNQLQEVCTYIGEPRETTINGRRAITHKLSCMGDYEASYIQDGETYLEIGLLHVGDDEDLPSYIETVNQIFSTFRFTN